MSIAQKTLLILLIPVSFFSCQREKPLFVQKKATHTQIHFANKLENSPDLNILTYLYFYNGGGVSAGDFNNDGLTDLYFTANQGDDKLYLNKGGFVFEDITAEAGIDNASDWTTGSSTVDINNDGLLDLYVCKVGTLQGYEGKNMLFVNQGLKDGLPTFKEEAAAYGLDFQGYATQAVFFDYDNDQDLDMFLMNHSEHPNRNYGKGSKRREVDEISGDKLFENKDGKFVEISAESGIFQGPIGYGLGLAAGDLNNDGYTDLYIGNDFFENDYLYLNQGDKTFKELISSDLNALGHTSHFSMGNAISDLNNDGRMDIFSLDMLPEELYTFKTSGLEYPYQIYQQYLKNGYAPQYMQNTLHLNLGNNNFSEIAYQSGLSATDWSWSPLAADFDNDGYKDLYISNGILGATNDMDFINFISNEKLQKRISQGMKAEDLSFVDELPKKKTSNVFFRNQGDHSFTNITSKWFKELPSYSNGATYADLDNDGDLDIIVNNINEKALLLENTLNNEATSYIKIRFKGSERNTFGIGARVNVFIGGQTISEENFTTRGYLSSGSPEMHLGLPLKESIDSLVVIWPGGAYQSLKNIQAGQHLQLDFKDAGGNYYYKGFKSNPSFLAIKDSILDFEHIDLPSVEFNRDPLVPYASTNQGPGLAVADINNDGLEDIFIGGGKTQASQLFMQQVEGAFKSEQTQSFEPDAMSEVVDAVFFDADNDGQKELLVVSGGNEFKSGKALWPRLYSYKKGRFIKDSLQFKGLAINASRVKAVDIDNDGDQDISIFSNLLPRQFGQNSTQYIFENDGKGNFNDITAEFAPGLQDLGNVYDATWIDLNEDSMKDLVLVGHWMPPSIFINKGQKLELQQANGLQNSSGWWNSLKACDFDQDGDIDLVLGNWGLNTRLNAAKNTPITLYSNDFDDNGSIEPVISYYYKGTETAFSSKDELVKQLPFLNKKFLSYSDFAKAGFKDLFGVEKINSSSKKYVYELASCYFENRGDNNFVKRELPFMAQISSVNDMAVDDFNDDGYFDILLTGNNYEISTQLGRFDASHGLLLLNDKKGFFKEATDQRFNVAGPARRVEKIMIDGRLYYIISINNQQPVFLKMNSTEDESD